MPHGLPAANVSHCDLTWLITGLVIHSAHVHSRVGHCIWTTLTRYTNCAHHINDKIFLVISGKCIPQRVMRFNCACANSETRGYEYLLKYIRYALKCSKTDQVGSLAFIGKLFQTFCERRMSFFLKASTSILTYWAWDTQSTINWRMHSRLVMRLHALSRVTDTQGGIYERPTL